MEDKVRREAKTKKDNKKIENNLRSIPPRKKGKVDFVLLLIVVAISLLGLYMVLSTTYYGNLVKGVSPYKTFLKQGIFFAIGLGIMIFLMLMDDYAWLKTHAWLLWIIALGALFYVLIAGRSINGADRWIKILGISVQPSEFAKYLIVIALAAYIHDFPYPAKLENKRLQARRECMRYVLMLAVYAVPLALIGAQKALSMTIVLGISCLVMTICSGINMIELGITALAGAGVAGFFIKISPWRWERVTQFIDWKMGKPVDLSDTILQSVQSRYAFASGGLSGKGMIDSRQKFKFLPMSDTDFVFSIIGEEFGFIWVALLVALYALLMIRGIRIAQRARCRFGAYVALGITMVFTCQTLINMYVSTTLMPVTGQALPLISQGGSSLLSHMAAMGLLLNISRETT